MEQVRVHSKEQVRQLPLVQEHNMAVVPREDNKERGLEHNKVPELGSKVLVQEHNKWFVGNNHSSSYQTAERQRYWPSTTC